MLPLRLRLASLSTTAWLASCTASLHLTSHSASRSWLGDQPCDERHELRIECPRAATAVSLDVRAHATSGALALCLVDPDGVERQRQVVRDGGLEGKQSWPAHPGTWRLFVEPTTFCGSYAITVAANDAPIAIRVQLVDSEPR